MKKLIILAILLFAGQVWAGDPLDVSQTVSGSPAYVGPTDVRAKEIIHSKSCYHKEGGTFLFTDRELLLLFGDAAGREAVRLRHRENDERKVCE